MAKIVVVVIQEDPRKTHRPVEALRIALGLVAGSHHTTVVLLGESVRLLHTDVDDIVDVDILEKYLPSIEQLEIPFVLQSETNRAAIRENFHVTYRSDEDIRRLIESAERSLIF
jgi:sulfur relay (sulfurtransferase) DsrF/TusC family protein